ncbi:MAG: RNA 2',3'-cyclic phosphodiesterase [Nanobdellota archaeon]
MRLFIRLDLEKEVMDYIRNIQSKLPEFDGKISADPHLTLKFIGENNPDRILPLLDIESKPVEIKIDSSGHFRKKIIWLNVEGADELQRKVDKALSPIIPEEKRFMGHITIARPKRISDESLDNIKKMNIGLKSRCYSISLVKSVLKKNGAIHEVIRKISLK